MSKARKDVCDLFCFGQLKIQRNSVLVSVFVQLFCKTDIRGPCLLLKSELKFCSQCACFTKARSNRQTPLVSIDSIENRHPAYTVHCISLHTIAYHCICWSVKPPMLWKAQGAGGRCFAWSWSKPFLQTEITDWLHWTINDVKYCCNSSIVSIRALIWYDSRLLLQHVGKSLDSRQSPGVFLLKYCSFWSKVSTATYACILEKILYTVWWATKASSLRQTSTNRCNALLWPAILRWSSLLRSCASHPSDFALDLDSFDCRFFNFLRLERNFGILKCAGHKHLRDCVHPEVGPRYWWEQT